MTRLQTILDILDQGLSLYRREFVRFLLIVTSWFVPVTIGIGLSMTAAYYWGETAGVLIILAWVFLLAVPLMMVLISGLSRATLAAKEGQRVRLRNTLLLSPVRLAGMGCYSIIFGFVANIFASVLSMVCICPLYLVMMFFVGSIGAFFGDNMGSLETGVIVFLFAILMLLLVLLYGFSMVLSGATYTSMVYALQPFLHENLSFGDSINRSMNLTFYRFGYNLLSFILASAIFAAITISVTIAVGVLLPLPLFWLLGEESPVSIGVSTVAWLLGLLVVLPLVPIWMTLFYQHNLDAYQGKDLAERIGMMS